MKPNFFIVGAQKCATTSLQHYLSEHPDIYLPNQKETKFFIDEQEYGKGIEYYKSEYFLERKNEKAIGEIDPDYMYFGESIDRMRLALDITTLKFIFILRNPIDRAFSHYLMTYRRGLESLSFEEAIGEEAIRIRKDYLSKFHFSYVGRGFYLKQIENYTKWVDREQILVLLTDDFQKKPLDMIKKIFLFLGVNDQYIPSNINSQFHKGAIPRSLNLVNLIKKKSIFKSVFNSLFPFPGLRRRFGEKVLAMNEKEISRGTVLDSQIRQKLLDLYASENIRLSEFLGRDLSHWI